MDARIISSDSVRRPRCRPIRVVVAAGGVSAEREVSLNSGRGVAEALTLRGHEVSLVDLRRESATPLAVRRPEVVFNALHGGFGEGGGLQAELDAAGIAYTGSGAAASALAMDKETSKECYRAHDIPTPPGVTTDRRNAIAALSEMVGRYGAPLVIKPATEGSSIGVTIAHHLAAACAGLEDAFRYSNRVLIERFIGGRELTVTVLDNRVLPLVEVAPSRDFYDYQAKYESGDTDYRVNPEMSAKVAATVERLGLAAYNATGCSGLARVDVILDEQDRPWVLEVNTSPGMTPTSLAPKAAKAAGMGFGRFLEEQVLIALRDRVVLNREEASREAA